ncbi:MAG: hypothetical protein HY812_10655 [Planctomycetes bacterium]|nr:hypothetical protein [Planctomycetota bacterium]
MSFLLGLLWPVLLQQAPAGQIALLTRLADPVAFLDAESQAERTLFHWDKGAPLRAGDGLRQGVAGCSQVFFLDDRAEARFYGQTHLIVEADDAGGHVLLLRDLRCAVFDLKTAATRVLLPGGTEVSGRGTWFRVIKDDVNGRYVIRNAGPAELSLAGPVLPPGAAGVPAGHEVEIPAVEAEPPPDKQVVDVWEGKVLRLDRGVLPTRVGADLFLEGEGLARVGGARIRLIEGGRTRIFRPRRSGGGER